MFWGSPVLAATVTTSIAPTTTQGIRTSVDIYVDPQEESINSVELDVGFPSTLLRFAGYNNSESSIPIWIYEPKEVASGVIHLAGIIPGGLERLYDPEHTTNHNIRLARLYFVATTIGAGNVVAKNIQLLKNDGKGTSITVTTAQSPFSIVASTKTQPQISPIDAEDKSQPQPFTVSLVGSSIFGRNPRLAVFNAQDKESGIEHYEAQVGQSDFQIVSSPYPLPYRLFGYTLTVRAYDFSGNYQEEQISVAGESSYGMWVVLSCIVIAVVFYRYILYRKRRRNNIYEAPNTHI